jgi:hypothetical protein
MSADELDQYVFKITQAFEEAEKEKTKRSNLNFYLISMLTLVSEYAMEVKDN